MRAMMKQAPREELRETNRQTRRCHGARNWRIQSNHIHLGKIRDPEAMAPWSQEAAYSLTYNDG